MKRFYKAAAAEPAAAPDVFRIALDGRPVRTPAKAVLEVPRPAFAEAVAEEWGRQGATIDQRTMPLTAYACTAIDLVAGKRGQVVAEVAAYGEHDLLCYRAGAPADLAARQQAEWQPLLDWAALTFDAPLKVTSGVVSVGQAPAAVRALRGAVEALDDFELTVLSSAVSAAGSLVIGLALRAGRLDAEAAFEAALLDELYQAERWGDDLEAVRRREAIKADLGAAARAFALLRV